MRTLLAILLVLPSLSSAAPLDEFEERARSEYLKPFALDVGGLLGAAAFGSGRALGFPGFEAGVVGLAQKKPEMDNRILRDAGVDAFGLPMIHAAIGLPWKFDVAARGVQGAGVRVLGAGLRYGILKSGTLTTFIPDLGVSGFFDRAHHDDFGVRHYGATLNASWNLPIIQPFVGAGADWTRVEVTTARVPGLSGANVWARGTRYAAGFELTPFPFFKLKAALLSLHGELGAQFGLGARF